MHEEDGVILGATTTAAGILLLSYAVNNTALQVLALTTITAGFIVIIATVAYTTLPKITRHLHKMIRTINSAEFLPFHRLHRS